jgi:hypothetical protein
MLTPYSTLFAGALQRHGWDVQAKCKTQAMSTMGHDNADIVVDRESFEFSVNTDVDIFCGFGDDSRRVI